MMQLPSLLLSSFRRQSPTIVRHWRYTTTTAEAQRPLLPLVLESPRFRSPRRNVPFQHFSTLVSSSSSSSSQARSQQPPAPCLHGRMMMSTSTEDTANSNSGSSSSNIQSQQRIKRFYKIVDVVEIVPTNSTTTTTILHPRPPPSQLVSLEAPTTTSSSADDDTTTASTDTKKWYTITLDGKQLKTPSGQVVMVPTITLAHLIAIEWNSVTSHIVPNQMPIMTYVCTVLDQVRKQKAHYEQLCFQYVMTDTLGYPAHPTSEPILYRQQQKAWYPIQHWIHSSFVPTTTTTNSVPLTLPSVLWPTNNNNNVPSRSFHDNDHHSHHQQQQKWNALLSNSHQPTTIQRRTIQKIPYDPALLLAIQQYISQLDIWYLLALYIGCKECKSFWLSCALLTTTTTTTSQSPGTIVLTPAQIVTAARLEEECNIQDWGLVEGQHDYDRLNAAIQVRSVALYLQALLDPPHHNTN